ncbi:MAG: hypothetical protein ACRDSZ_19860 [Pseudonocardiaceae bacterium]
MTWLMLSRGKHGTHYGGLVAGSGLADGELVLAVSRALRGTAVDLVRLGGLVSYPLIPAVAGIGVHLQEHRLTTCLLGAAASWLLEGLAFWPAFFGRLGGAQDAPAKTPR